jgi:cation:H+ antiporter
MSEVLIFIVSLAVLIGSADLLIAQSEIIAKRFGLSEFFIGATLIALGTSLPEMAASVAASLDGHSAISLSNIIGSNILNITLVLGVVFLIARRIDPHRDFFAKDSSWALFPVFIFLLMIYDGTLSRLEGGLLLLLMGAYLVFLVQDGREILEAEIEEDGNMPSDPPAWSKILLLLGAGFVGVIVGADYLVESASAIARTFDISEWIIGVVMIAMGTSMPELVVSIAAARRGKADMAIGNIIGSNMANISVALGAAALARPLVIDPAQYAYDLAIMTTATLMLVFIAANKLFNRSAGISLLIVLVLFLTHLASAM